MAITAVASTTSSTLLLAAGSREAVIISNSDANDLYVLLDGGTASASNLSFILATKTEASLPAPLCNAEIRGVWAADGSGSAHITVI